MSRTLYMFVGVPCSGKSSYLVKFMTPGTPQAVVLSTDNIIEDIGHKYGITYDMCFRDLIQFAENQMFRNLAFHLQRPVDIIWDQTNLSPKVRAKKLALIPADFKKIAVNFAVPSPDVLKIRNTRPGKTIPDQAMEAMIEKYIPATLDEGFDEIINVDSSHA
jgi:predicted kinase